MGDEGVGGVEEDLARFGEAETVLGEGGVPGGFGVGRITGGAGELFFACVVAEDLGVGAIGIAGEGEDRGEDRELPLGVIWKSALRRVPASFKESITKGLRGLRWR